MKTYEQCLAEIQNFCRVRNKLTEESILKIKIKKADYNLEDVKQAVAVVLDGKLVHRITAGKTFYRVVDTFTRDWIVNSSLEELENYSDGEITIRGLHYRMVSRGMTNSDTHYSRVKSAMVYARRAGLISFTQFSDYERETIGTTASEVTTVDTAVKRYSYAIEFWLENYYKNRWENQPYYPEIWIEKKALIGVFEEACKRNDVLLSPCKGYPSLTFLKEAADRFSERAKEGKSNIILYFGDYDASGEDIPRSLKENLLEDFGVDVEVRRVLLLEKHVMEMGLPPAPTKSGDSRGNTWGGLGQVELDSVEPKVIQRYLQNAIDDILDANLYEELLDQQKEEKKAYQIGVKNFVENYTFDD